MRKLSSASVAMILAIAFYFATFWGFDALRMLTSPTYGLEDVWRSQFVFELGRVFGLAPFGLIKLAAFLATLKLAVAAVCAIHIADRFRALAGGRANSEFLDAGLVLALLVCLAALGPAIWQHNVDVVREHAIALMLVGVASGLGLVERSFRRADKPLIAKTSLIADNAVAPRNAQWFSPLR
ncbi:MAG TPA: hypothetical protein VFB31_06820 [Pseudolabrys sp.]|nr:hypothetical protein [Pseudolabrys sp.]